MSATICSNNLKTICSNIKKHSPYPSKVQVVAVTKGFDSSAITSAISNQVKCIGENRVQEFSNKTQRLDCSKIKSHLIGHLQSNKAKKATELFDVIQTIDSTKLAQTINKHALILNKKQHIYIQINIGNDTNKFGFTSKSILNEVEKIQKLQHLTIKGVMTILPYLENIQETEPLFNKTRQLAQDIQKKITPQCTNISMGMSRDYIYALRQGATHIRIGTMLYGQRPNYTN